MIPFKKTDSAMRDLLTVMAALRSPGGCPWDREQTHSSLRFHAVEEVYELLDAIEAGDDHELVEELGDVLLQVVFHAQLARERGAFDFETVARTMVDKLVRRHPHVFGNANATTVDAVWAQWDQIKKSEKLGTHRERGSVFDGIPKHLPALMRAEKLLKKARKLPLRGLRPRRTARLSRKQLARELFELAEYAQSKGWSAEELLRAHAKELEKSWRTEEKRLARAKARTPKR